MRHIKTNSIELRNGDILLGVNKDEDRFFVKTVHGIAEYNEAQMLSLYKYKTDLNIIDLDSLGLEVH